MSLLSATICRRTSTKSHSTVAAETTHTQSASAAASRTKGLERRRREARLDQGSPSSLEADSRRPPLPPPPPTRASSSRRFLIFLPTRSGTAWTPLSIARVYATASALHFHYCYAFASSFTWASFGKFGLIRYTAHCVVIILLNSRN